jgi:hypothetical protein
MERTAAFICGTAQIASNKSVFTDDLQITAGFRRTGEV